MRGAFVDAVGRGVGRRTRLLVALLGTLVGMGAGDLPAQNLVSVPLPNGFIGTRGSSAGSADNVKTFATLGISRLFFIQNSSTNQFELQGNDIPGTLRIVRTNGTTLDIPSSANWRMNSGSTTDLIGILPRPAAPITFTYAGGSIQITDGSNAGGTSIGGYVAGFAGTPAADGSNQSGNAAQSQLLNGLNAYLATVVSARPAGPVTVTAQTTGSTTPTIAGTATLAAGELLSVVVNGVQYTTSSTPAVVRSGNAWSLALTTPLAAGTYSVTATVTDADGFTLSDATSDELVISGSGGTVTIGGSFTADAKTYDATTAATGSTGALTLVGVNGADQVTIASVTLAFQSAAAGAGRTVVITAVTLGGANGAQYAVSLAGAPTATATIAAKALTVTGVSAVSRAYDATTTATLTGTAAYAGLVGGETFAVAGTPVASFATAAAGTAKAVTVAGYAAPSANYTVTQPTGLTADVTARPVTLGGTFTAAHRAYDGTTAATLASSALTLVGVVGGDVVTLAGVTAAFADPAAGTAKPVALTGATLAGAAAGNYVVSLAGAPTATANITIRVLTLGGSFTVADRVYDGTTDATILTNGLRLVGVQAGDDVALTWATAAFADAAVGAGKRVTLRAVGLTGAHASTYTLVMTGAPTTTASIVAAAPPSAPRAVAATATSGGALVTWTAPEAVGCRAITGYVVEVSADGGRTWRPASVTGAASTTATIAGLTNNLPHLVRVAAVNPCGTGAFAAAASAVVPVGPMPAGAGLVASTTVAVVQDTMVRVSGGGFTLDLRADDETGAAMPVDSSRTLQLEHGGRASVAGTGFAPGTYVTLYVLTPAGPPTRLGTVPVAGDGTFAATLPIAATLPAGAYTLQVSGIDPASVPRAVDLPVEIVLPPPDLDLAATPDEPSPAVGDTITITLTVTNVGRGPAIDVVIPRAFAEPGFIVVRTTPLEGTYHAATQEWTIGRIEPGARARLLLTAVVLPPAAPSRVTP